MSCRHKLVASLLLVAMPEAPSSVHVIFSIFALAFGHPKEKDGRKTDAGHKIKQAESLYGRHGIEIVARSGGCPAVPCSTHRRLESATLCYKTPKTNTMNVGRHLSCQRQSMCRGRVSRTANPISWDAACKQLHRPKFAQGPRLR